MTGASEVRTLTAECTRCGGKFAMTDVQSRVWAAYAIWDAEHKHDSPSPQPAGSGEDRP